MTIEFRNAPSLRDIVAAAYHSATCAGDNSNNNAEIDPRARLPRLGSFADGHALVKIAR